MLAPPAPICFALLEASTSWGLASVLETVASTTILQMPVSEERWRSIEEGFKSKWNFRKCIGFLDRKHVVILPPLKSGSAFYNHKPAFSVVPLALVDADCKFIYIDVGNFHSIVDSGVLQIQPCSEKWKGGTLQLPPPQSLSGMVKSYIFYSRRWRFSPKPNLMKSFSVRPLNKERSIHNYWPSRAGRMVANAFGKLANRFDIFKKAIVLAPEKVETWC